jgi:hypothetical protein
MKFGFPAQRECLGCMAAFLGCVLAAAPTEAEPVAAPYKLISVDQGKAIDGVEFTLEIVDAEKATATFTFHGDPAEAAKAFGINGVWILKGKQESDRFVFRDAVLARVKQDAGVLAMFGTGEQATVHDVMLQFRRLKDDQWEVALAVDVTLASRREVKSKSILRLEPLLLGAEAANKAITATFGKFIPPARLKDVDPKTSVMVVDEPTFVGVLVANGEDPAKNKDTFGVTDRRGPKPVAYVRPGAPPYTPAHELTHMYQNPEFRHLGKGINEGFTHFLTEIALTSEWGTPYDFEQEYVMEVHVARKLGLLIGTDLLKQAYFGEGAAHIDAMRKVVDSKKGAGTFDRVLQLTKSNPSAAEIAELQRLLP